jgi:hypothetical protein
MISDLNERDPSSPESWKFANVLETVGLQSNLSQDYLGRPVESMEIVGQPDGKEQCR